MSLVCWLTVFLVLPHLQPQGVTVYGQGVTGHGQGVTGLVATGRPLSCGVFSTGKPVDLYSKSLLDQRKMLTRFVACIETTSFLDIDGLYFSFEDNFLSFNHLSNRRLWVQESKYTGLMAATLLGFNNLARTLIRYNANINMQNEHGTTSLFCAALAGNNEMVKFLLGLHAPVNGVDHFGDTPLVAAATNGDVRTVRLLLDNGADRDVSYGKYHALAMANYEGHKDVVAFLNFLEAGGDLMNLCRKL